MEDGTIFPGEIFGARQDSRGEVVFNTGMTGYQEALTDPSYAGQILVLTYPLIGNYGVNKEACESDHIQVRALVVREHCREFSNWQAEQSLDAYLAEEGICGLAGVDTRALTRHLRTRGTMKGVILAGAAEVAAARAEILRDGIDLGTECLVEAVSTRTAYTVDGPGYHVALLDYGVKQNIIRRLRDFDCRVTVLPARTTAAEVLALRPDGVVLSNGPGDPKDLPYTVEMTRALLGKLPVFGICLGHQILGRALGGDTYKLKFGHRGANHPVKDLETGRVHITSQNHGYAVQKESLDPATTVLTHVNLNDGTVEGLRHRSLPAFSIQYHPEASPGPQDNGYLFERFLEYLAGKRGNPDKRGG